MWEVYEQYDPGTRNETPSDERIMSDKQDSVKQISVQKKLVEIRQQTLSEPPNDT